MAHDRHLPDEEACGHSVAFGMGAKVQFLLPDVYISLCVGHRHHDRAGMCTDIRPSFDSVTSIGGLNDPSLLFCSFWLLTSRKASSVIRCRLETWVAFKAVSCSVESQWFREGDVDHRSHS